MPRPSFYKLVLAPTLQSRQLRIPDYFMRKYGALLSTVATLTIPDGTVWRLGLKKVDNGIWFVDGWQDFVQRYSIGIGYLLVFMYEGNSSFTVHIFNMSTAELNYQSAIRSRNDGPCYANFHHIFGEMEDIDSFEFLDSSPSNLTPGALQDKVFTGSMDQLTPAKNHTPSLQNLFNGDSKLNLVNWGDIGGALSSQKTTIKSTKDIGVQFNANEFKKSNEELKLRYSNEEGVNTNSNDKKLSRKKRKSDPGAQDASAENDEEAEMRYRFYESASARRRTVTAEERERAINDSKAFEPTNPFCRVVLRPSYLYRGCIMYLPSSFAEKNLNGVSGFIKLTANGREWPVRCLYKGGRAKLSQGWYEFTVENNLGEGDVCVFELLRTRDIILEVTLFRVAEDESGLLNPSMQPSQNVSHAKLLNPHLQHRVSTNKSVKN